MGAVRKEMGIVRRFQIELRARNAALAGHRHKSCCRINGPGCTDGGEVIGIRQMGDNFVHIERRFSEPDNRRTQMPARIATGAPGCTGQILLPPGFMTAGRAADTAQLPVHVKDLH